MAVRPVSFVGGGDVQVSHDELGHAGLVALADIRYGRAADGSVATDAIELVCPVCGALSVWPVGGGADGRIGQFLHALAALRRMRQTVPATTFAQAKAFVRARIAATDGDARWAIQRAQIGDTEPQA